MYIINKNVLILEDTLQSFPEIDPIPLYYARHTAYNNMRKDIHVYLPKNIEELKNSTPQCQVEVPGHCKITCDDSDTYTMACKIYKELKPEEMEVTEEIDYYGDMDDRTDTEDIENAIKSVKCMVLNFANPEIPGGGARKGAYAQEEDLCRRSSLILSLESDKAKLYYNYNKKYSLKDEAGNNYGTNSLMLTPYVEVIKDKNFERKEYAEVAVLTSAMPIIKNKLYISEEYVDLVYQRINSVLLVAAHYGYTHLVLGAWGCGAFGNDSEVVARLFRDAIDNFSYNGKNVNQLFERISFAVPYSEKKPENYLAFKEQFGIKKDKILLHKDNTN